MADFDRMVSFFEAQTPETAQKLVVQFLKHDILQVSPHCTKGVPKKHGAGKQKHAQHPPAHSQGHKHG